MSKHTPGPWRVDEKGLVVAGKNGLHIARAATTGMGFTGDANARLIAAAPDGLRAAELAYLRLIQHEPVRPIYPWRKYSACPQCGSTGMWGQNDTCGHCLKCSTWVWREPPVPWSRSHDAAQAKQKNLKTHEEECSRCGDIYESKSRNGQDKYCPRCRDFVKIARDKERKERIRRATTATPAAQEGESE